MDTAKVVITVVPPKILYEHARTSPNKKIFIRKKLSFGENKFPRSRLFQKKNENQTPITISEVKLESKHFPDFIFPIRKRTTSRLSSRSPLQRKINSQYIKKRLQSQDGPIFEKIPMQDKLNIKVLEPFKHSKDFLRKRMNSVSYRKVLI